MTEAMGGRDDDGSSPPTNPSMGGDSLNGEGNAAADRAMQDAVTLMCDQSSLDNTMRLNELKTKREKVRLYAREVRRNAESALLLTVMTSGVADRLKELMRQLRKTEIVLRTLNEEIEPFIHSDSLDEEYATDVEYQDEITHVMIRIYYELKYKRYDAAKPSQIDEIINSSTDFNEFCTLTEGLYDPLHVKNFQEASAIETLHVPPFLPQEQRDNATTSLAARDLRTEDALTLCAFQETADISMSKSGISSTPLASPQAMYQECFQTEITDLPPGELKVQNERYVLATKRQSIVDAEERGTDHHDGHLKRIVVARILQQSRRVCGKRSFKKGNASHNDSSTTKVQRSRKKPQGATKVFSGRDVYKLVEYTSEFRGVEDLLRISAWLRRLHRLYRHVLRRRPQLQLRLSIASEYPKRTNELKAPTGRGLTTTTLWAGKMGPGKM